MNIKKTCNCILIAFILFLAIPNLIYAGIPLYEINQLENNQIMVSIYDDINDEFIVENTKLIINEGDTLSNVFTSLVEKQIIKAYYVVDDEIVTITANNKTVYSREANLNGATIIAKINAVAMPSADINSVLNNGDIVEIFYTTKSQHNAQTSSTDDSQVQSANAKITLWDTELVKISNDSFDWLNRNIDSSSSYILVSGISSKAPNVKSMNVFLAEVQKKKQYTTPSEISKDVISLTLNGVDASTEKNNSLIQKLSIYDDIMSMGIFGGVNTLTAYNCSDYYVPNDSINSRTALIEKILSFQNDDGGFPVKKDGRSDIDTTAMTITALSSYIDQPAVKDAIDNSITYLSENQSKDGGFGYMGQSNLESLASVIVALNSIGIDLNDERFFKGDLSLIQSLLQYKNSDGGFAHTIGEKSSAMPTEQALIALASIKKSGNPYKLPTPLKPDIEAATTENISMKLDNAPTIIIISIILAILSLGTICILFIGKKINKKK